MSRGVLDQAAYDAACAAARWAEAHGKRAFWDAIHYAADGSRTFRFRYEDLPKRRAKPVEVEPERRTISRGAAQGALL